MSMYSWRLAAAISVLLAGCGGGDDAADPMLTPQGTQRESAQSMVPATTPSATSKDVFYKVKVNALNPNGISVTRWDGSRWLVAYLKKNDGSTVSSIDDLPEGIANLAPSWRANANAGHLRILFEAGTYQLTKTWVWDETLSGINTNRQIVLEPLTTTTVVTLSGAKAISGTSKSGTYSTALGTLRPNQLWAEGVRAVRARTPNVGSYYYIASAAQGWRNTALNCADTATDCVSDKAPGTDTAVEKLGFFADPASVSTLEAARTDTAASVVILQSWTNTRGRPVAVNADTREVLLAAGNTVGIPRKALMDSGRIQRYFVENVSTALDAPREWYVNASGTLTYRSSAASVAVNLRVPALNTLLRVQGASKSVNPVQWVQFNRLNFNHTNYAEVQPDFSVRDVASDFVDEQAAYRISAAIEINDARNIEINGGEVARTGGHAIWLHKNAQYNTLANIDIYDTGAGGIKVGLADVTYLQPSVYEAQRTNPSRTGFNTITGNRIYSTGHVFPGGVGIWIGRSHENKVTGNLIKDTTYTGVSVGWDWSTINNPIAYNNEIAGNFLLNIGQGVLADLGGIYTLGNQANPATGATGTRVQGNVIKNVEAFTDFGPPGGSGLYQDQGSSWMEVSGNLVDTVNGWGYTSSTFADSPGHNNKVQNNAFVRVQHFVPAPLLNGPAIAQVLGFANVQGQLSSNVVVPTVGVARADNYLPAPSQVSLSTPGNLISDELKTALATNPDCDNKGTIWCAVTEGATLLSGSPGTDAFGIQQFTATASGLFTTPKSPANTTTWASEGAKLKSVASAAPAWKETSVTARGKGVAFAAGSTRLGTFSPTGGWYLWNPGNQVRAIEQGADGVRALRMGPGVEAYAYPEINGGTAQVKARVYVDGTTPVTFQTQHENPDQNGAYVTLTPQAGGTMTVRTDQGVVAGVTLQTGRWYEITLKTTVPGAANPGTYTTTTSIRIDALTPNGSTGTFTATTVHTGSNFSFVDDMTTFNRFVTIVGAGTGSVRLNSLYIDRL